MKQKPIVGEQLLAEIPAGRHSERRLETATVTKVGRKYFSVLFDNSSRDEEFFISDWRRAGENTHCNFPINLYRSREEMDAKNEKSKLVRLMADNFRYSSDWNNLDLETLRGVTGLVGIEV